MTDDFGGKNEEQHTQELDHTNRPKLISRKTLGEILRKVAVEKEAARLQEEHIHSRKENGKAEEETIMTTAAEALPPESGNLKEPNQSCALNRKHAMGRTSSRLLQEFQHIPSNPRKAPEEAMMASPAEAPPCGSANLKEKEQRYALSRKLALERASTRLKQVHYANSRQEKSQALEEAMMTSAAEEPPSGSGNLKRRDPRCALNRKTAIGRLQQEVQHVHSLEGEKKVAEEAIVTSAAEALPSGSEGEEEEPKGTEKLFQKPKTAKANDSAAHTAISNQIVHCSFVAAKRKGIIRQKLRCYRNCEAESHFCIYHSKNPQ